MTELQKKIRLLSKTELFSTCDGEMIRQIAGFCSLYSFPRGGTVFRIGDPGNSFYIVRSGEIAVFQRTEDKREQEIARYGCGDSFGEIDMLMNTGRNADARAAEKSELVRFPGEDKTFLDLVLAYPPTGAELLRLFMQTTSARLRKYNGLLKENSPWVNEMRTQVYGDKLTGLFNKTYLEEQLPGYLRSASQPVSLFMIKPDNFKLINDNFGHEAGDQALVAIGSALAGHIPENAVLVRFMGNELACVFPGTGREKALRVARDIQGLLNSLDLSAITKKQAFRLSVSIGIAVFPDHAQEAEGLISRAHALPLIGREQGGNRILFSGDA
ncbi:MAG: GGDEF domain-containing protein [Spirochaetales bacterium]|jgi:diguanylate cyclase (GGDEF)-like protein|nr:GGDEF domain-containing protein [Spirochaetales bacterium]